RESEMYELWVGKTRLSFAKSNSDRYEIRDVDRLKLVDQRLYEMQFNNIITIMEKMYILDICPTYEGRLTISCHAPFLSELCSDAMRTNNMAVTFFRKDAYENVLDSTLLFFNNHWVYRIEPK